MFKSRTILVLSGILLVAGSGAYVFLAGKHHPHSTVVSVTPPVRATLPPPEDLKPLTDIALPWQMRVDLLRQSLESKCGENEMIYLYGLLDQGAPQGEVPEQWYVIANDIMEQLSRLDSDEVRFSSRMLAFLDDPKQPPVLRDYAVQHLATWINPGMRNILHETAPSGTAAGVPTTAQGQPTGLRPREIRERVLRGMVAATMDPQLADSSIPGTTCMMLVDLSRDPSGLDCRATLEKLKPWLRAALANDSKLANPLRVSAVQAAALAPKEFGSVLRSIAYHENGQSSLRLAAIANLAGCGDASDLEKLLKIGASAPELALAADDARRSLISRLAKADPARIEK